MCLKKGNSLQVIFIRDVELHLLYGNFESENEVSKVNT